jgi:hypothetical protein
MPEQVKPSIVRSAVTAWRDAFKALRSMKAVSGIAFLLILALTMVDYYVFPPRDRVPNWGEHLGTFVIAVVQSFLVTPLAIAVHRYVLLGEITQRYLLDVSNPRFLRFFGFAAALYIFVELPFWIIDGLIKIERLGFAEGLRFVGFVLVLVLIMLSIRSLILFPAIAVDAPGAGWGNALLDSKGHGWRIFFIIVVTALPIVVVMISVFSVLFLMPRSVRALTPDRAIVAIVEAISAVMLVMLLAAMAAVASRLYAAFGNRLGRPAGLSAASVSRV